MSAITVYAKASSTFAAKLAATQAVLQDACTRFTPITQASSLGAEDMVITHLLHTLQLPSEIFVLQTGKLHAQTNALLHTVQTTYGVDRVVRVYEPDAEHAASFVQIHGEDAMVQSMELRKACCDIRKMVPLAKALKGKKAWITGLRREQSNARAEVLAIESPAPAPASAQGAPGATITKVNPLADWTNGDVWHYIATHHVPYNALHDEFYPSIGCAPCTRAVTLGEDFRSGRWWWETEAAKECGLHVAASSSLRAIPILTTA
jgi:phosphoadenosine phosphosulfate reductase